jgi:hypothetical protein
MFKNEEIERKLETMKNMFSYNCDVIENYSNELGSNNFVKPKFY